MSYEPRFPDLYGCVRRWKGGYETRTGEGERVRMPWVCLKVRHFDLDRPLFDKEVTTADDADEVCAELENRIEARCKPLSNGSPQQIWIDCEFMDGKHSPHTESWNGSITLPPNAPAWGHTSYAGMGRDLGNPQTQSAIYTRHTVDMHHAAMTGMHVAEAKQARLDGHFERIMIRQDAEIARYQAQEVSVAKLFAELQNDKVDQEARQALTKMKVLALSNGIDKLKTLATPLLLSVNRFARDAFRKKKGEKIPLNSARAQRALQVFKNLIKSAREAGAAKTPEQLEAMLKLMGATDETIGDVLDMAEEAAIEEMENAAMKENEIAMRNLAGFDDLAKLLPASWTEDDEKKDSGDGGKKESA